MLGIFNGNSDAISALIQANILTIPRSDSDIFIQAASPLYLYTFKQMCEDKKIRSQLDKLVRDTEKTEIELKIQKIEDELLKLSQITPARGGIENRKVQLDEKLLVLNNKLGHVQK